MRKKSKAPGCSAFMRTYCCMAGVWGMAAVDIRGRGRPKAPEYTPSRAKLHKVRVLAVDTTTARGSVALVVGGRVAGEVRVTSQEGHSRWLFAAADQLLGPRGHRSLDVDGFAVTLGPGSFTGVRVGIATVQGLALGAGRPCVGLSALDVLASRAGTEEATVVALMDAWRDEVYAGVYEAGQPAGPARAGPLAALVSLLPPRSIFVGDGALRFRDRIGQLWPQARVLETDLFLAAPLGRLAERAFRQGEGKGPESLTPLYLRGADIRRPGR